MTQSEILISELVIESSSRWMLYPQKSIRIWKEGLLYVENFFLSFFILSQYLFCKLLFFYCFTSSCFIVEDSDGRYRYLLVIMNFYNQESSMDGKRI